MSCYQRSSHEQVHALQHQHNGAGSISHDISEDFHGRKQNAMHGKEDSLE